MKESWISLRRGRFFRRNKRRKEVIKRNIMDLEQVFSPSSKLQLLRREGILGTMTKGV